VGFTAYFKLVAWPRSPADPVAGGGEKLPPAGHLGAHIETASGLEINGALSVRPPACAWPAPRDLAESGDHCPRSGRLPDDEKIVWVSRIELARLNLVPACDPPGTWFQPIPPAWAH